MADNPKPRRKLRLSYSLRALLVFITLFMLWGGYHANRGWKERAAEDVLRSHHASLTCGPKRSGTGFVSSLSFAYQKLIQFVWRERFITSVTIYRPLEPEMVDALCVLPHLQSLTMGPYYPATAEHDLQTAESIIVPHNDMPSGAMTRILGGRRLQSLKLSLWILSDEDCHAIGRHPNLIAVALYGCDCSEEGFAEIAKAPRLTHLSLLHSDVTGENLAALSGSSTLENVICDFIPLKQDFAAYLARCPNLASLEVRGPSFDDKSLAELTSHPSLAHVALFRTTASDASIPVLMSWPALQDLDLRLNHLTESAAARLRKAYPNGLISFQE
jgi:hypothetical protein